MDFSSGMGLLQSLRRFCKLFRNSLSKEFASNGNFYLGAKRVFVLGGSLIFFPSICVWTHIGFWLDDLLFPDWRNTRVSTPCFIIGNARSGTTWFHRILAKDCKNFTCPKTWEIIFAQSITHRLMFHKLAKVDKALGEPVSKLINWVDNKLLAKSTVHPMGLMKAEEDEWLMTQVCSCQLMALIFPLIDVFHDLIWFDKTLEKKSRKAIMVHYHECIKRHLYAHRFILSEGKTDDISPIYLSKNPTFTLRIASIHEEFPDAQFIVMVRNPYDAIPSMVSYIQKCWHVFAQPKIERPFSSELQEMCVHHYTYPRKYRSANPNSEDQITILHYEDCKHDILKAVRTCYQAIGKRKKSLNLDDSMVNYLKVEQTVSDCYRSSHIYSIEACCGMQAVDFQVRHSEAFDMYPRYKTE
mmetsp:Transcript_3814/g.4621  ORF Transcript_3814/g.4621 Transcript_3814/m.4621 type:complete len:412 (-) Transcript_3814:891-2126(-)